MSACRSFTGVVVLIFCALRFSAALQAGEWVPLLDAKDPTSGWTFNNGGEFPGAVGGLSVDADAKHEGNESLKLLGDFTKGGAYVQMGKKLAEGKTPKGIDIRELGMWVRNPDSDVISLRINDASGQTHQIKLKTEATSDWQHVILPLERFFARRGEADAVTTIAKYESWGGAKDGAWHGPATAIYFLLGNSPDKKVHTLWMNEIAILPRVAFVPPPPYKCDFEGKGEVAPGWKVSGDNTIDTTTASGGTNSMLLSRSLDKIQEPCSAIGPKFTVAPGQWDVSLAHRSDLHSSDNSYNAVVQLESLDSFGKTVERMTIVEEFGQHDWHTTGKRIEIPKGVVSARFHVQLNKADGKFWIDDLTAAYIAPSLQRESRVTRILFSTVQLGNLLLPTDSKVVDVTIEARRPLAENQRTLTYVVRDYWGAEQSQPATVNFPVAEKADKKSNKIVYKTKIDLSAVPLEIGRYYELHASVASDADEPFANFTSLAILPEAETKKFKPEEIPFTCRNWDNRIGEYIKLADRLGVRICGLWGGWDAKPPYKAEAPQLNLVKQLGMGWLTTTPCAQIEAGKKTYSEAALRGGVRNLINEFGSLRPMVINLGNEPHGKGERVLANVEAYRIVYDEVKKVDATIPVVATSVEPNEEYFKAGYGKYCDAYDFHIYETAKDVRRTIGEYRELMKKYDVVKPIWSTELGLNSQGMTRHVVAVEVIKKFTTFFASGGVNVSWFGILYPDTEGKSHGSSGDSHNIFDCRFNHYCPRLDAIAYYNGVNAISIKKFIEEKTYDGDRYAFLFRDRDNHNLQVLWREKGSQEVFLPLPGVQELQIIRIDGSRIALNADGKGITLSIGEDPLLLLYSGAEAKLAAALEAPAASIATLPKSVSRKDKTELTVTLNNAAVTDAELVAPPFWNVAKGAPVSGADGKRAIQFTLTPPNESAIRELDFAVKLTGAAGAIFRRVPVGE